jgi:hypothetical protein
MRQPRNPRTIAQRSHPSSLVVSTSREDTIQFLIACGIALTSTTILKKSAGGKGRMSPARRRCQRRSPEGPRSMRRVDTDEHGVKLRRRRRVNATNACIQSSERTLMCNAHTARDNESRSVESLLRRNIETHLAKYRFWARAYSGAVVPVHELRVLWLRIRAGSATVEQGRTFGAIHDHQLHHRLAAHSPMS